MNERLKLESKIISQISHCEKCRASTKRMGQYSPIDKIRRSGLWLVQNLNKEPFSKKEIETFFKKYGKYWAR